VSRSNGLSRSTLKLFRIPNKVWTFHAEACTMRDIPRQGAVQDAEHIELLCSGIFLKMGEVYSIISVINLHPQRKSGCSVFRTNILNANEG
jgi:hypothetical protein